jgi:hypothetical protein
VFLFSLCRGVRTILIGFKFPREHQNAKYGCGDVNKKASAFPTLLHRYQNHWLVSHASVVFKIYLISNYILMPVPFEY